MTYVGLPTAGAGCAYSEALDTPRCGAPAAVHVLSIAAGWGAVGLPACPDHTPHARAAGDVLAEHAYADGCGGDHENTHWAGR